MALVDANGLPIALSLHDAAPHESTLVFDLIQNCWTEELPETMVGDKAYDSDILDSDMLENFGIEVIAPHRSNRKPENKTQDTVKLRRKKRRWKVERFFSWLQNFRRMVVRYERKARNFYGFVQLSAIVMHVKYQF